MNGQFKLGDVVELKSGGPEMTVVGFIEDTDVICEWFNQNWEQPRRYAFCSEALRKSQ